ncbi:phage tail domain-containing protein [Streptomyces sp. UH6]|uniref:phage tail domain-containing protein n=1 Tax=Streptomyces sp. UH6 TaxID=2748379 RepID=UPI0015D4C043|nr:phage tail domain-containing protein [Streptomyces sp. UH6]NYV73178.1 phage tail family protein [Streptomyces sp. UH6]
MPLITALTTSPDPTPETPAVPAPQMPVEQLGCVSITYVDPTGRRWMMTDLELDWWVLGQGVSGLGATPYTVTSDPHPRGGAVIRHVQAQARTIVWPMWVQGDDHQSFIDLWRELGYAITRTLTEGRPGWLEVSRPDGRIRRIAVTYQEGWEGQGSDGSGITWDKAVVTFLCPDPYWVDTEPESIHRESGTGTDYLVPYPTVSSSQTLGDTTLVNRGNVEVWPSWTLTGPLSAATFTRTIQGPDGPLTGSFTLTMSDTPHGPLLPGETVIISTDPPSVRSGSGENLLGGLDWPTAVLWSLPPGETEVSFVVAGSGPGTAIDCTYYPRYETA